MKPICEQCMEIDIVIIVTRAGIEALQCAYVVCIHRVRVRVREIHKIKRIHIHRPY